MIMEKNINYAIALNVRKVCYNEKIDESCIKFYGNPCLPESLVDKYSMDTVLFAQIRCEDLKELDIENRLPHTGYLYFFLDAKNYPRENLSIIVDYFNEEPKYAIDDYNESSPIVEGLNVPFIIEFLKVNADYDGTKLLGRPNGYVDENDDMPGLLLQYDPLDFDFPFLSSIDGYAYVFYGKNEKNKFSKLTFIIERS